MTTRLDALITEIREKWHRPALEGRSAHHGDVAIVAHGHILRAFAQRWTGSPLNAKPAFLMEAGGVGTLRYVLSPPLPSRPLCFWLAIPLLPPLFWGSGGYGSVVRGGLTEN